MEPIAYKSPYASMGKYSAILPPAQVIERVALSYAPPPTIERIGFTVPPVTAPTPGLHYTIPPTPAKTGLHYTIPPTPARRLATTLTFEQPTRGLHYVIPPTIPGEKEPMKWYTWILIAVGAVLVIRAIKK